MTRWISCSLAAAFMLFLVGAAFHLLVPIVAESIAVQYKNEDLFRPWPGWTSTYMAVHPLAYGFVFAGVFLRLRRVANFQPGVSGGILYGFGVFLVGSLPVFLLTFASFQVSVEIIGLWIAQNLIQYLLAGMAVGMVSDGLSLRLSSQLAASPERVWETLLRKDTFLFITRGILDFGDTANWPDTLFSPDVTLHMTLRPFGLPLPTSHEVRVVRVDAAAREIETVESGRLVSIWKHRMRVETVSKQESIYSDHVELKAGVFTPVVWLFACWFYFVRQRRWRTLLAQRATEDA